MSVKYADRAFITVNGQRLADVQSASLKINRNTKVVPSMTSDGYNKGFVQGNMDIDISCTVAVQNQLASPKIEFINFENNDIALTFECGADSYTASGLWNKDTEQSAGGVGDEVKKSWNFGALKLVDSVGNSALFDLQL